MIVIESFNTLYDIIKKTINNTMYRTSTHTTNTTYDTIDLLNDNVWNKYNGIS